MSHEQGLSCRLATLGSAKTGLGPASYARRTRARIDRLGLAQKEALKLHDHDNKGFAPCTAALVEAKKEWQRLKLPCGEQGA